MGFSLQLVKFFMDCVVNKTLGVSAREMNPKSLSKKLIASLTGLLLALTLTPASQASVVYEQASTCSLSGAGTQSDPYLVWNVEDLLQFQACANSDEKIYFEQQTNIYLDSSVDYPSPFVFGGGGFAYEGNGFGIIGLQSNTNYSSSFFPSGLFGGYQRSQQGMDSVEVKNLYLRATDIIVSSSNSIDSAYVGGLFSRVSGIDLLVEDVVVVGDNFQGSRGTAGLIADAYESMVDIRNSHVIVSSIRDTGNAASAGGMVAAFSDGAGVGSRINIEDSSVYSAIVSTHVAGGTSAIRTTVGGFVGSSYNAPVQIKRSIFEGSVSANKNGFNIGGAVGWSRSDDGGATVSLQDVVLDVSINGGTIGGFVGEVDGGSQETSVTIQNSIITGSLNLEDDPYTDNSAAVIGFSGSETNLVMQNTIIDVDFNLTSQETNIGGGIVSADQLAARNISTSYFNSTKADASEWPVFDDHGVSHWGLTALTSTAMRTSASFPSLSFAAPNGAGSAGVFEICSGFTRPLHSIESSSCNAPAIQYSDSLNNGLWDFVELSGIADHTHFKSFNITPALPKGLELNPVTGKILGHPQESIQETTFTVTAVSDGGPVQDSFQLSVSSDLESITYRSGLDGVDDVSAQINAGLFNLPAVMFTVEERLFGGWKIGSGEKLYKPGDEIFVNSPTELIAVWYVSPECSDDGEAFGDLKVLCNDSQGGGVLGLYDSYYGSATDAGDYYFIADSDIFGQEIWKSNGNPAGTQMISDINTGIEDSIEVMYHVEDDLLFYSEYVDFDYNLMTFNLETGETKKLAEGLNYSAGWLDGKLYFGKTSTGSGYELWSSDGTVPGTTLLKDINPGASHSYPDSFVEIFGKLYFVADDGAHGYELWETDGTTSGTKMTVDIVSGSDGSDPYPRGVFNNQLVIAAYGTADTYGYYLFDPQTDQLTRLTTNYPGFYFSEVPGGFVFTSAASGEDINELWFSDGTPGGTSKIMDLRPAGEHADPGVFLSLDGVAYFTANDGTGESVYKTDGTANGTSKVFTNLSNPDLIGVVNGNLILSGDGTDGGKMMYYFEGENSFVPEPDSDNAPADSPSSGAAAPVGVSTGTPVITSQPVSISSSTESFEISGSNLQGVVVEVSDKPAFSRMNAAGNLDVIVPDLSAGVYDLVVIHGSGRLSISDYLIVTSDVESEAIDSAKPWTTMISDNEIKLYFKNPAGQGKVQFFHNGNEVAWVNAEDASDEKLRVISSGPMTGANYLVRTRALVSGKNVFEIYLDGERVERRAQTLR